jgi:hypothetical protein
MANRTSYGRRKPPVGALLNRSHPLAQGLVARWLFNEQGGTRLNDISGRGKHGTLTNGPVWNNQALLFDGANDYVSLPSVAPGSVFTISAWVYSSPPSPLTDTYSVLCTQDTTQGLFYHDISKKLTYYQSGDHFNNTDITDNVWTHVMVTYNAGNGKFYRNGLPDGTFTVSAASPTFTHMGDNPSSETFKGSIDDVRIYSRELSSKEAYELFVSPYCDMLMPRRRMMNHSTSTIANSLGWMLMLDEQQVMP